MAMCLPSGVLGTHPPLLRRGARSFKFASDFYSNIILVEISTSNLLNFPRVPLPPPAFSPTPSDLRTLERFAKLVITSTQRSVV